jgi:hypothetical protein
VVTRQPGSAPSMAHATNLPGHLCCMSELHKIATRRATPSRSRRGSILNPAAAEPSVPGLGGNRSMRGIRKCSGIPLNSARIEADERPIRECAGDCSENDFIGKATCHVSRQSGVGYAEMFRVQTGNISRYSMLSRKRKVSCRSLIYIRYWFTKGHTSKF